ncbi:MAG: Holliday junction resolvase RuvX [Bacteroidia bacterium]|nr:Holliday junction resolvase RuvX [Bacteroidia bacterium]MCZ2247800.1 Holliday junction resolvase RuvX [Bacteroidia bacterium]
MSRIMCFDYGTKRVGIAVSDPMQMIAGALCTLHPDKVLDFIIDYKRSETISCFVVGLPKNLDNSINEVERYIKGFIKKLNQNFPNIPVERIDERFTSVMAQKSMVMGGIKKSQRQEKGNTDQISATILLQDYLRKKI